MKPKRKITKPKSPAQKIVQQLGMDLFATGSTSQLIKFFRNNGMPNAASQLEQMVLDARALAKVKYTESRKQLDPSWKSPLDIDPEIEKWLNQH